MKRVFFMLFLLLASLPVFAEEEGEVFSGGLEAWSLMALFEVGLILLFLGLLLHLASFYNSRILNNFKIRLSGENFGVVFVLIRDLSLFASFGIGVLLISPDIFEDVGLALPFIPLGTIVLGIALYIKLSKDMENNWKTRKIFTLLLSVAALLQYFGFIFIMEGAPTDWVKSGHAGNFWLFLKNFRSNVNPSLSMWTFYICFPLLIIIFLLLLSAGLSKKNWEEKKRLEKK